MISSPVSLLSLKAHLAEAALVQPGSAPSLFQGKKRFAKYTFYIAPGAYRMLASASVDGWATGGIAAPALELLLFQCNLCIQFLSSSHALVRAGSLWERVN